MFNLTYIITFLHGTFSVSLFVVQNTQGVTLYGGTAMPGRCEGCNNGKGGDGLDAGVLMEAIGSYVVFLLMYYFLYSQ